MPADGRAGGGPLRLVALTALAMLAFALNSILTRLALAGGEIGPLPFAALRLASGAVVLALALVLRGGAGLRWSRGRAIGAGSLLVYMLGFSLAYVALDAGLGALILFGGVQVTMFAGAVLAGEAVPRARAMGAVVAAAGLVLLLWPEGAAAPPLGASALMTAAALGWGVYSLAGRGVTAPTAETAANFIWAAPVAVLLSLAAPWGATAGGVALALASGILCSAGGYALWYALVPDLGATRAALAQLTVPVIAVAGGAVVLGEGVTPRLLAAAALVLGGVALGLAPPRQRSRGSSGS